MDQILIPNQRKWKTKSNPQKNDQTTRETDLYRSFFPLVDQIGL